MSNEIQFLLYNMPDADGKVQVVIKGETLWCTQKAMAQLFGVGVPAISKHLKNIFDEGELDKKVVVSKMEITHLNSPGLSNTEPTTSNSHAFTYSSVSGIDKQNGSHLLKLSVGMTS